MRRPDPGLLVTSSVVIACWAFVCPPAAGDENSKTGNTGVDARVVVTSTRLDDKSVPEDDVPSSVTIIDRTAIESSGARNLQDLLADDVGIVLIDQVGNDVQKTLDLRGFAGGKGIAVFVDGARANDPRNNTVALEQVPLDAVERVEITRGPMAALAGGGAEAGVVRIVTRRGTTPAGSLAASAGTSSSRRYDGAYGRAVGRFDLFVSGTYDASDGFRPNAGGHQTRLGATGGFDLGGDRRLSLSLLSSGLSYGNPGALTRAEFDANPYQNVYNLLDYTDDIARQAALNFQGPVGSGFSLAANLAYRSAHVKSLTTGRIAIQYGGFLVDSDGGTWSGVAQATRDVVTSHGSHRIAFGLELLDGGAENAGFSTPSTSPGSYDSSAPASRNTAAARNAGLFVQDAWTVGARWTVTAGARGDGSHVRYVDTLAVTTPSNSRAFSQLSFRGGVTFRPVDRSEIYFSYGDAFLPPTPEQLFAFPGFGSNANLSPENAHAYELGTRTGFRRGALETALFWTDTKNEIVFDPAPTPNSPYGQNVNIDATRRYGVEVSARGSLARSVQAFVNATYTHAEFTRGGNVGNEVPLVPKMRTAAGIDASIPRGFAIRAEALYVGAQVLDNDEANKRSKLDAYTVVNLRAAWERALRPDAGSRAGRLGIFIEANNLFDRRYATRGIFATDYSTPGPSFASASFVTPAPGRRYLAGATWRM